MARMVSKLVSNQREELTPQQRKDALKNLRKAQNSNPLRRVQTDCCGWVRDPLAQVNDRIWCDTCSDWATVHHVAE